VVEKPFEVFEYRFLGVEGEKYFFDISREDVLTLSRFEGKSKTGSGSSNTPDSHS